MIVNKQELKGWSASLFDRVIIGAVCQAVLHCVVRKS